MPDEASATRRKMIEGMAAGFAGVIGMTIIKYVAEKRGVEFNEDTMIEVKESVEQICTDALESQHEMDLGMLSEMIEVRIQSLIDRYVEDL